ncbi:hypothetical protein IV203_034609 [Nitzschia inconspicua]|uniref:Uncharacterized protein n=1 Tax=Nitzschia inconspicua TaxID=303405 RepID=A0A9K3LEP6_9STRA|nr:hypothetical protein IV203_002669 [Nitzschia inconspicua]KAG7359511.1 hypothetical protein IV203_034609 [Nitzschia inconspicua]
MKVDGQRLLVLLLAQASLSVAFSPPSLLQISRRHPSLNEHLHLKSNRLVYTKQYSSQWDDDEDDVKTKPTSFDQAGENLKKEDDDEKLNSAGNYDANPSYNTDTVDQIRAAIKKRAEALGIEESKEQIEYRKKAEERAKQARENFLASGGATDQMQQMLDLSKISSDAPGGQNMDGVPTIFYDPESEMTDEEKAEADPVGELPIIQQGIETLKKADFPSFWTATVEVFSLVLSIVTTASLFIGYDYVIRNVYQWTNILPTEEEVRIGIEQREKRMGMKQSNEKDLMESLKNFEQDVPSDL